jgi:1-acyl-sn-glycerol-3-phosphate acyltransferase
MTKRKIPLPSAVIINFMNVIYAVVYLILKPIGLAPAAIAFLTGGLFGLLLLPVVVLYAFFYVLREYIVPEAGHIHDATLYGVWSFVIWYLWTIATDDSHLRVQDTCFREPQTIFDRISYEFFLEIFDYFPMTCVPHSEKVKQQLSPSKQYVFGVHPHGIHCFPLALLASRDTPFDQLFPGLTSGSASPVPHPLTGLAATVMFKIPVVRELFLVFGYIDARRAVADAALRAGKSIFVVTGGEEESMYAGSVNRKGQKEDVVVLQHRKGFVRLALHNGADLVPIYGIGNDDLFETYSFALSFRCWIQKTFQIALPIFHGRFFTPLPYRVPLKVVVGEPIVTPKPAKPGDRPDEKLVEEYHRKYIAALKELHSKHVQDRPLRIV